MKNKHDNIHRAILMIYEEGRWASCGGMFKLHKPGVAEQIDRDIDHYLRDAWKIDIAMLPSDRVEFLVECWRTAAEQGDPEAEQGRLNEIDALIQHHFCDEGKHNWIAIVGFSDDELLLATFDDHGFQNWRLTEAAEIVPYGLHSEIDRLVQQMAAYH